MSLQLFNLKGARIPDVSEADVADEQAFHKGALLVLNEYGELQEFSQDVYTDGVVEGIALARFGIDGTVPYLGSPSFDILGGFGFPPGRMQYFRNPHQEGLFFSAEFEGTLPANAGGSYELIRSTDGKWRVNFAATTNAMVKLESIDWTAEPIGKNRVVISFLPPLAL